MTHGIERPAERLTHHKSAAGRVDVRFEQHEDGYILIVRDDGRGIDAERLRVKALEQGMGETEEIKSWNHERLMSLIFAPGFSTASAATQDAGRGVGMDLVTETVEEIDGHVEMSTVPDQYCEFRVVLPKVAVMSPIRA